VKLLDKLTSKAKKAPKDDGIGRVNKRAGWMMPDAVAVKLFPLERKKFYRRIQIMARAQLPFSEAIEELRSRAFESKSGIMFAMLDHVFKRQRKGDTIGQALRGWVPPVELMLLEAGDLRGFTQFANVIDDILMLQTATSEMKSKVIMGLIEPVIMVLSMYALIAWMSSSFNAKVLALTHINPDKLTGLAAQFYTVGVFSASSWAYILPLIVTGIIAFIFWSMPHWCGISTLNIAGKRIPLPEFLGTLRKWFDKVPPWSIYRAIIGSSWMLIFSVLGNAGYTYEDILVDTAKFAPLWLKERLLSTLKYYRRGAVIGEALRSTGFNFPSKGLIDDLVAFGTRPGFEAVLLILAKEWVKNTTDIVNVMAGILTGIGYLVTFGGMVWIMGAFNAMQTQIMAIASAVH
jgi:type II secretory pathway component PulF